MTTKCACDCVRQQRIQFLVQSRNVIGNCSIFVILFILMQKFELMLKIWKQKSPRGGGTKCQNISHKQLKIPNHKQENSTFLPF